MLPATHRIAEGLIQATSIRTSPKITKSKMREGGIHEPLDKGSECLLEVCPPSGMRLQKRIAGAEEINYLKFK
jgi:hypothetical protein